MTTHEILIKALMEHKGGTLGEELRAAKTEAEKRKIAEREAKWIANIKMMEE